MGRKQLPTKQDSGTESAQSRKRCAIGASMNRISGSPRQSCGHKQLAAMVKEIVAGTILIIGTLAPATVVADEVTDAIKARIDEYRIVWNSHDENAVAAFYTEDAAFVIGNLPAVSGRQTVAAWWRTYFDRQEPERQIAIAVNLIRPITADTAVASVTTTTGGRDAAGRELLSRRARGTWLLHRRDGGWFIAALYAMPPEDAEVILNPSLEAAKALTPRIRAFVEDYENAFNSHDAAAVGAFFTDDADIIVRNGPLTQGRQAIDDAWRTYFSDPVPFRAILIVNEVRMITSDVALIRLTVAALPVGETADVFPARHTHVGWVVVRRPDGWRISSIRVMPSEDDQIIRASDR